jgi:hypothetical protein
VYQTSKHQNVWGGLFTTKSFNLSNQTCKHRNVWGGLFTTKSFNLYKWINPKSKYHNPPTLCKVALRSHVQHGDHALAKVINNEGNNSLQDIVPRGFTKTRLDAESRAKLTSKSQESLKNNSMGNLLDGLKTKAKSLIKPNPKSSADSLELLPSVSLNSSISDTFINNIMHHESLSRSHVLESSLLGKSLDSMSETKSSQEDLNAFPALGKLLDTRSDSESSLTELIAFLNLLSKASPGCASNTNLPKHKTARNSILQLRNEYNKRVSYLKSNQDKKALREQWMVRQSNYLITLKTKMRIENFEVISKLGHGGIGIVSLVKEKNTGELYAMKSMKKDQLIKRRQEEHVRAERDLLSRATLVSEWIIKLVATFQDTDNVYLIMEYMPGGDLLSLLIKKDIFSEPFARHYCAEMILAIEEVHKLGFSIFNLE